MKTFKVTKDLSIVLDIGDFTECNSDITITFPSIELNNGCYSFMKLKNKAGNQYQSILFSYRGHVNYCDSFTTIPGFLPCNIIVNSVYPHKKELFNDSFYKIKETILNYSKNYLSRYISITIPDTNYKEFCKYLVLYFKLIHSLSEIHILVEDRKDYEKLNDELTSLLRKNKIKEWISKFFNIKILKGLMQ